MKSLIILISVLVVSLPLLSHAQAQVTWISGVGDDANPGDRTAPCKTIAGAISKTRAGGVIEVLDPGGFGAVTITKSITIDGNRSEGGILVAGTAGIVIAAHSTDSIIIRNFTFEGLHSGTSGIRILSAGTVHIENCRINGFIDSGIDDQNNVADASLFIKGVTIHGCTNGISLAPSAPEVVTIQNADISACGAGIEVGTDAAALIAHTSVSGNSGVGIESGGLVRLTSSAITENGASGLSTTNSGQIVSYLNNLLLGNHPNGKPTRLTTPK